MQKINLNFFRNGIWSVLREPLFRVLWITNVIAFIATWIHEVSVSWLMTSITSSPLIVSLVQTAMNLPFFLLSIPAGALADIMDRKHLIIGSRALMTASALGLGILTLLDIVGPATILVFTLLMSFGSSINSPTWQAVVPELIKEDDVPSAITLGSVGFNIARIVGPALGGIILGLTGAGITFLINALLFSSIFITISSWKRRSVKKILPSERFFGALKTGIRYTMHAPDVKSILFHVWIFCFFANSLLSFIPLVGRTRLDLGPFGFGLLYGFFGLGGLTGATLLPRVQKKINIDNMIKIGKISFALIIVLFALSVKFVMIAPVLFLAGFVWIILISSFNVTIQSLIPSWVRGRVASLYMLAYFGSMALGSVVWGVAASFTGITSALIMAAVFIIIGIFFTRNYKVKTGKGYDFSPYKHQYWPQEFSNSIIPEMEERPVLIQVEYCINPKRREEFLEVMRSVKLIRLRDGAYRWDLFQDVTNPRYYVENFLVESWTEHLRQHARRTVTDNDMVEYVRSFHIGTKGITFRHFLLEPIHVKKEKILNL